VIRHIIIGNSAAGVHTAETIRKLNRNCSVTIISDENTPCYSRCLLPNCLSGEMSVEAMTIRDKEWYEKNNIELILNTRVLKVDEKGKKIILDTMRHGDAPLRGRRAYSNTPLRYDRLLIATGSSPLFPPIPGMDNPMVFGFRTISDVQEIENVLPRVQKAVILGAGFIGLKAASALQKRDIHVTVIEKLPHILPRMLDNQAASILTDHVRQKNIEVRTRSTVAQLIQEPFIPPEAGQKRKDRYAAGRRKPSLSPLVERERGLAPYPGLGGKSVEFVNENSRITGVQLETGETIECDMVIMAAGVTPNTDLIEETNIKRNRGILIDEFMQTSVPDIYAAGDVAESIDSLTGARAMNAIWPSAVSGGNVAGHNMVGIEKRQGFDTAMNSLEFFGLPVISAGLTEPEEEGLETVCQAFPERSIYKKIVLKKNKIVGMIFMGDISKSGVILLLMQRKVDVFEAISDLVNPQILNLPHAMRKFGNVIHYPV
jgi:NAD(P)H-nitrite reductase large subunit